MAKRKWTPEEREAFRQQQAEWAQERRDFAALAERYFDGVRVARERRERRRELLRRFLPFVRPLER